MPSMVGSSSQGPLRVLAGLVQQSCKGLLQHESPSLAQLARSSNVSASQACSSSLASSAAVATTSSCSTSRAFATATSRSQSLLGHAQQHVSPLSTSLTCNTPATSLRLSDVRPWALAQARGFAAKGKAAPAAGKGGDAKPAVKKLRRQNSKLYACRNERFRAAFEQIWPTLPLSEEQQGMFKRNSRLFVVDLGKAITLKNKFGMARAATGLGKPYYADGRRQLTEQDLHLDSVGEHPRYLRVRRMKGHHGARLVNMRKVRLLVGGTAQRRAPIQRMYEQALVHPGPQRMWKLVCAMEGKLAMVAMRTGLAHDVLAARGMLRRNRVFVNGAPRPRKWAGYLAPGDVVGPAPHVESQYHSYVCKQMGPLMADVYRWYQQGPPAPEAEGEQGRGPRPPRPPLQGQARVLPPAQPLAA